MKNTNEENAKNKLKLNIDLLNQSFQMRQKREELLAIRLEKEINKLTQSLITIPEIYADDLISIFQENINPKDVFIKFLSDKINVELISSLDRINNIVDKINKEPF